MSVEKKNRWQQLRDRRALKIQGGKKDPTTWPFCIGCHLAAPEARFPMDARDASKGRAPDLSKWGAFEVPNKGGFREKHHACENCTVAIAMLLLRINKSTAKKLQEIREAEARNAGLIPKLAQSISAVKNERIIHADECVVHDDPSADCTCGAGAYTKR